MTLFIPEWGKVSGRGVHIKRVLNTLGEGCVVRRPVQPAQVLGWTPHFFVQQPGRQWAAVAVLDAPFTALDPHQLFSADEPDVLERLLLNLQGLDAQAGARLGKLVLLWACSPEEADALDRHHRPRYGVRLGGRDTFLQRGAAVLQEVLAPLEESAEHALLGRFFPEAEIPVASTTRRFFRRDNSARLTRHFLDHDQEWATKLDLDLPAEQAQAAHDFSVRLINGVAGSGKTLIALSRALLLADLFPSQRVLVLIHNTPIVAELKLRVRRLGRRLPPNLEIQTFFGWAYRQWRRAFRCRPRLPEGPQVVEGLVCHHRLQLPGLRLTDAQVVDELDFINDHLLDTEAGYLAAARTGRGFSLRPEERAQVWQLHERVGAALRQAGQLMWSALPRDLCLAVPDGQLPGYHHVLIDEAQFFAPSWLQLVKRCTRPGGQVFLCADPNQGFMKSRLSWKSAGLEVAGRTKRLRKSYRSTRAILEAANAVLAQCGAADADDFLSPDFAGMPRGTKPLLVRVDSPQDAVDRVVNEVAALGKHGHLPLEAVLVVHGERAPRDALYARLVRALGRERVWWVNQRGQKKEPPRGQGDDCMRLASVDTATGMEAGVVFLLGLEDLFSPGEPPGLGAEELVQRRERHARKLYMAMTRAGRHLVLLSTEPLPAAVQGHFEPG